MLSHKQKTSVWVSVGGGAGLGSVKYIIKILPQHTSKEVPLQRNKERIGVTGETKECESTKLQACLKPRWISLSEESCGVSCLNVACDKRNRHIEIIKCKNEKLDIDKHQTFLTCVLTPGLAKTLWNPLIWRSKTSGTYSILNLEAAVTLSCPLARWS